MRDARPRETTEKTGRKRRNTVVSHMSRETEPSCGHRGSTRVSYARSFTYSQRRVALSLQSCLSLFLSYPFSLSLSLSLFDYKRQEAARSSITRDTPRRQIDGLCQTSADPPGINELANDANPLVIHLRPSLCTILHLSPLSSTSFSFLRVFSRVHAISNREKALAPRIESNQTEPNRSRKRKRISGKRANEHSPEVKPVAKRDLLAWRLCLMNPTQGITQLLLMIQ